MHFLEFCALFAISVYTILVFDLCTSSTNKYNNNNNDIIRYSSAASMYH